MQDIKNKVKLFLVDDDAQYLKSMAKEFCVATEYEISTFATGELCLQNLDKEPTIIVLDYQLDAVNKNAMNGLETLDKIKEYNSSIQAIFLSSQDSIEVAVSCMRHKAYDYVVKSETAFVRIQNIITTILHYQKIEKELNWYMNRTNLYF